MLANVYVTCLLNVQVVQVLNRLIQLARPGLRTPLALVSRDARPYTTDLHNQSLMLIRRRIPRLRLPRAPAQYFPRKATVPEEVQCGHVGGLVR